MENIKELIYEKSPHFVQNVIISLFNILAYKKRYSKKYNQYLKNYKSTNGASFTELKNIQKNKYNEFITFSIKNSAYYKKELSHIKNPERIENLKKLPIINKESLRQNLTGFYTIKKSEGEVSKTGGTTGKSLEVLYTYDNIQERFAILDNFRSRFGYELGKKTAWFSGKKLLSSTDIKKNRFWKTDNFYNVRYYSTFHIHNDYLGYYLENLLKFKPEYMVGFPSTMHEIAKYGQNNNIDFPSNIIKAIFPTAETVTENIRYVLESYFKTNLYNQYASSEGAPFVFECKNKKLHLELQSGVFEVLDDADQPAIAGRLIVTSFTTYATPLIRYDIGDEIELSNKTCSCGNKNPLVEKILGRVSDYIYSEEIGKINLGNISNCLKGVIGIIKFQIQQSEKNKLLVLIEKDNTKYNNKNETIFLNNLRDRIGSKIEINLSYVMEIPVEKSGKYRLVKNSIKL